MKNIRINYYFNDEKKEVYAVTRWYGETVKAKAKCSPNDEYDIEVGKKLAEARLEAKIAKKDRSLVLYDIKEYTKFANSVEKALKRKLSDLAYAEHTLEIKEQNLEEIEKSLN